jgi:hypothetical protein
VACGDVVDQVLEFSQRRGRLGAVLLTRASKPGHFVTRYQVALADRAAGPGVASVLFRCRGASTPPGTPGTPAAAPYE